MQELDVWWHGLASCLTKSLVEDALQLELSNTLGLLDLCSHLKQSIAGSDFYLARRITAAHNDGFGSLGKDLEVVGDLGAYGVLRLLQSLGVPQLAFCVGIAVLLFQVLALVCVACQFMLTSCTIYTCTLKRSD